METIAAGFLASLAAGLATGLGALPVLFVKKASDRLLDAMMGFAGGVMIVANGRKFPNQLCVKSRVLHGAPIAYYRFGKCVP